MESGLKQERPSLGDILVKVGIITPEQLKTALAQCDPEQRSLGPVLVSLGFATEEKISKAVSIRLNIPFFTTFEGLIDPDVSQVFPESLARKLLVVPIFRVEDKLTVGMVNPTDLNAMDQVAMISNMQVQPVVTTLANLFDAIQQVYGHKSAPVQLPAAPVASSKDSDRPAGDSVSDLVNVLLQEGVARKASDIHIESGEKLVRVRFRIDGMLQDGKTYSKDMEAAIMARIKIMSKLDITETRLPQDGHIRFTYGGHNIDVRVSTLPTVHGEKAVLRLLDHSASMRKLHELGIASRIYSGFTDAIASPNGLILVTGPTGSGKTTTLYAAIASLNKPGVNIVTLEDPVEYVLERVNQVESFSKIGLTFAAGLRAILRQDPNIILVGEIRDLETAEIAMQASITGHLVFSTLHTNDAISSVHRLLNMNVEPFMIAAALRGVMAQRLMRRLCDKCKRPQQLSPSQASELGLPENSSCFEAVGCPECGLSGYSGRFAIHEWMSISRNVRDLIVRKAPVDELRAAAEADGFVSMRKTAMQKVLQGETSIEEAVRLTREQVDA